MFLAPLYLLGLAAALIPLILHLRRARQVRKITFSTTRFFDEQFIRAARRARLQDLLLMLLRMALFCLLALALAQPLMNLPWAAGLAGGARQVAIVLDDSASMAVKTGSGTPLDQSKSAAQALLAELKPARGDRAALVLAGRREAGPAAPFAAPTTHIEKVRQHVESVAATDLATDVHGAIAKAAAVLGIDAKGNPPSGTGSAEIYVFSDLQSGAFGNDHGVPLGPQVGVFFVSARPDAAVAHNNVSIDSVQYGSTRPMRGVPFTVRALITNHGDQQQAQTVRLVVDGKTVGHKSVKLPVGSTAVRFSHQFDRPGWRRGHVELVNPEPGQVDAMRHDDRRHFVLSVDDQVKVLAVNGSPSDVPARDELLFVRVALWARGTDAGEAGQGETDPIEPDPSGPAIEVDQILAPQINAEKLAPYPLILLANVARLEDAALQALEKHVDKGASLLITLGDRAAAEAYDTWIGTHRMHGGLLPARLGRLIGGAVPQTTEPDSDDAGFVAWVESRHPALAGRGQGGLGDFTTVRFHGRYELKTDSASVLMRASTGEPLLVEKRFGAGRVMLLATSIDRDWTDFPVHPTFLPWLYRLVSYLAQGGLDDAHFVRTGQVVTMPRAVTAPQTLRIQTPAGTTAYPTNHPDAAAPPGTLAFSQTESAGIYEVRDGGDADAARPAFLFAANTPSSESQAQYVSDPQSTGPLVDARASWHFVSPPHAIIRHSRGVREGLGLWNVLLIIALAVALFEPWLANRLTRLRGHRASDALGRRTVATPNEPKPQTPTRAA